jgi:exopolysaccharide biosynthesis polyprenyl glycosylphosphotransferase
MFGHQRKLRVLLGLSDTALSTLAFAIAYRTRFNQHWHFVFFLTLEQKALILGFSLLAWVTIGSWLKVYDRVDTAHPGTILRDATCQIGYGALCLLVFEYALRIDLSRFFLVVYATLAWALLLVSRFTTGRMMRLIRRGFISPHYVMVVGTGERAMRIARALEGFAEYGVHLRGFISEAISDSDETAWACLHKVFPIAELPAVLRQHVIDEIIFAVGRESLTNLEDIFVLCDREGVRTRVAVDFFPHVNSKVSLEHLGAIPLLTFSAAPYDEIRLLVKRVTDIGIAAAGLAVLSPLMGLIAILVRLTTPGPALFRQVRCGLNGRQFLMYKFRTMCENAEELKPALAHLSTRSTAFKIQRDPRLTNIGRYLRKFSIDEWPQLWNVLCGDMSLVGPRPAVPTEVEQYEGWQRRRLRMRPGLTCLWAVFGRDNVDFETWMTMDMQYIDNWSLALDWKILLRTVPRVVTGDGAN